MAAAATLKHTHSADILFPEDEPRQAFSDVIYSPPSASSYSSYSQEVRYFFTPQQLASLSLSRRPRAKQDGYQRQSSWATGYENVDFQDTRDQGQFRQRSYSQDIGPPPARNAQPDSHWNQRQYSVGNVSYLPPSPPPLRRREHPPLPASAAPPNRTVSHISRSDSRRRTWSPPTFNRVMGTAGSAIRSYRSNEQLDAPDSENTATEDNIYEDLDSVIGSPCKLPPVSGKLNAQNAHRSLIKPVAYRPMLPPTPPSRYVSTPQRASPAAMQSQLPPASTPNGYLGNNSVRSVHSSPGSANSSIHSPPSNHRGYPGVSPQGSQVYSVVDHRGHNHSHDDGYASQDYHSHTNSTASQGSLTNGNAKVGQSDLHNGPVAVTYVSDFHSHMAKAGNQNDRCKPGAPERPGSYTSASSAHGDSYIQTTPSPSDSGVGEVEALIREKEAELTKLRDTMERNEQAILQVYQERKQNWAMEMRELNEQWDKRLKYQQQKAFKTEQGLLMQLFKLQQEKKTLKAEYDQALAAKEDLAQNHGSLKDQCEQLKGKLEDVQWELQQKAGEISLLKSQLKEAKEDSSNKSTDLLDLKSQLKESQQLKDNRDEELQWLKTEAQRTKSELQKATEMLTQSQKQLEQLRTCSGAASASSNQSQDALQQEVQRLGAELASAKAELASCKTTHQQQYDQWLEEKNKVIRYQKHLQLNYTQMHRKNKMLEAEIEQLTLELENRDIQLSDVNASIEERESMC